MHQHHNNYIYKLVSRHVQGDLSFHVFTVINKKVPKLNGYPTKIFRH